MTEGIRKRVGTLHEDDDGTGPFRRVVVEDPVPIVDGDEVVSEGDIIKVKDERIIIKLEKGERAAYIEEDTNE